QKAKGKGQQAVCANNLRQIYLAFALYADDFNSSFPWSNKWYDYLGSYQGGVESTTAFGPRRSVQKCPAERPTRTSSYPAGMTVTMYDNFSQRSSYMMNMDVNWYSFRPGLGHSGGP